MVTGAAQGIGASLAKGLARAGARVVIADIVDGEKVAADIVSKGGEAVSIITDVSDDASLQRLVELADSTFDGIDILVNNAALFGKLAPKPLGQLTQDEWDRVMIVNVRGVWQCVKAVIPSMSRRGGGSIINISSNRIYGGYPNLLHYDASKGAVAAMTKSMAVELGDLNIRVNAIAPGLTMSERVRTKEGISERNEVVVSRRALKRSQMPEDLAGAVVFLASDSSAFVSGQSLNVDGGSVMR